MDAQKKLLELRDRWQGCAKCGLAKTRARDTIVFGSGPSNADILVIAEAPTEDDEQLGVLLSDDAGQLIEELLEKAGIKPSEAFITSLVGCRPFAVIPATEDSPERTQDREPTKEEINACKPRLHEIIYLVDPYLIIAMGKAAWMAVVKDRAKHTAINSAAGELFEAWVPGRLRSVRYPVIATLPPKVLMANPSVAVHGPITTTLEAFTKAAHYVRLAKEL